MLRVNVAMQKNRPLNQYLMIFSLICLLGVPNQSHARLYKWIDADGNTHYTQQPPPDGIAAEDIKLPASVNIDTEQATKSFEEQQKEEQELSEAVEKEEKKRIRQEEHADLIKENCKKAKAKLENVQNTGRIKAVDEEGNVVRATEEERQRRIKNAQESIKKWCS